MRLLAKSSILIGCLLALLAVAYVLAQDAGRSNCAQMVKQNEIDAETWQMCSKVLCPSPTFADMRGIVERKRAAQACK